MLFVLNDLVVFSQTGGTISLSVWIHCVDDLFV